MFNNRQNPLGGVHPKRILFTHTYDDIISVENLLEAWKEFIRGKRKKKDVEEFQYKLMDNILALHRELKQKTYKHGTYEHFKISDPKPRDIHKATVRDRLVHHAIYRILYPFFDCTFISDSYSCRYGKGTHKAMNRFRAFAYKVSQNHTRTAWVLKCDIRKFFASIDQHILLDILATYIPNHDIRNLLKGIILSFCSCCNPNPPPYLSCAAAHHKYIYLNIAVAIIKCRRVGLPLGNLTSQLLVNIYMNEFDQYVKHKLKARYYVRYADDFVILSPSRQDLAEMLLRIEEFLTLRLNLLVHPHKVFIKTFASGVDFLGWVHFPDHRVLRTSTKRRMLRRLSESDNDAVRESYRGLLGWGNGHKLSICV